jgi:nucleoside-diphosphate-sugar epimerase
MNILIIGGTGVLSSAVTAEALKKGIAVTMINRGRRPIPDAVELIKADMNDHELIKEKLAGRQFDAVMDFLCYTDDATKKSVELYSDYTKQYFFISSCAVYDTASLKGQTAKEDSKKVLPIWSYSVNKWKSEELLMTLFKGKDANFTVIRPSITYGNTRVPYGIMPPYGYHWTLCARILAGKPIITWNGGNNRCNMTRVEDFAVGVIGLVGNPKAYGEAFNVCGEETHSFNDVLTAMSEYLHKEVITVDVTSDFYAEELPSRAGEILGGRSIDTINSNNKLKGVVPEFKQTISLKEGIAKTLDAYKRQDYQNGIDWTFDADTDRIIKKWCKKNRIDTKKYRIGFIDYIGNARVADKIIYWRSFYQDSLLLKVVRRIRSCIHH